MKPEQYKTCRRCIFAALSRKDRELNTPLSLSRSTLLLFLLLPVLSASVSGRSGTEETIGMDRQTRWRYEPLLGYTESSEHAASCVKTDKAARTYQPLISGRSPRCTTPLQSQELPFPLSESHPNNSSVSDLIILLLPCPQRIFCPIAIASEYLSSGWDGRWPFDDNTALCSPVS